MKSTINIPKIQRGAFRIADICDVIKGNTPTMKAVPGKYPLVVTAENRKTCENYQFDCEAVCIPLVSSTGHGHADIKRIHYQNGKFALANIMVTIIPKDGKIVSTKYLFHLLNTKKDEILVSLMRGTANVTLKIPQIENIMISLPSINEQKIIISKIEKFNIKLFTITQLLQKTAIQLGHWKQSSTSYALGGKQHERLDNSKMSKEQIQVPKGWELKKLSDVCKKISSGGTPSRDNSDYFDGNIPWVKMNDMKNSLILDTKEKITKEGLDNSSAKILPKDTVLLAMYTEDMGRTSILGIESTTNQAICALQVNSELHPKYLFYFLISQKNVIDELGKGGAQSNINQGKVKNLQIVFPSLPIQKKIVQKLDQVFSLTEYSKNIIKSQFSLLETMRDSLLKKYFQES